MTHLTLLTALEWGTDALIAVLFGMGGKLFCCAVGAATLAAMVPHLFDMWKVM